LSRVKDGFGNSGAARRKGSSSKKRVAKESKVAGAARQIFKFASAPPGGGEENIREIGEVLKGAERRSGPKRSWENPRLQNSEKLGSNRKEHEKEITEGSEKGELGRRETSFADRREKKIGNRWGEKQPLNGQSENEWSRI